MFGMNLALREVYQVQASNARGKVHVCLSKGSLKTLTGLLQLAAFSFRTIKSWSRVAGDFRSPTSKCRAKITIKSVFVLLKHKIYGFTL